MSALQASLEEVQKRQGKDDNGGAPVKKPSPAKKKPVPAAKKPQPSAKKPQRAAKSKS
jgi:hypothetical protein